jgi:enterochelin esterase-like enzyme
VRSAVIGRRGFVALGLTSMGAASAVPRQDLRVLDLELPDGEDTRKARVLIPEPADPDERVPVLLLFHGMGETRSAGLGLRAWPEFYGLKTAHAELGRPPLPATPGREFLTPSHRRALNASLATDPFRGLIYVCVVTPNARKAKDPAEALDRLAAWTEESLLPEVRRRVPRSGPVGIDGVSLGGYVALELFTRRPHLFDTLGAVQAAFGPERATEYAERLTAASKGRGAPPVHLETSTDDPFREANELLGAALSKRRLAADVEVLPGPHNQAWLKQVGTLAMLRWQDRALRRPRGGQ